MKKTRVPIRNHQEEANLFSRRALLSVGIVFVVFAVLLFNLYSLQVTSFSEFQTRSNSNRITILPVAPNRGLIYDRNGVLLADNIPVYSLEVSPADVGHVQDTLQRLQTLLDLTDDHITDFNARLRQTRRFPNVTFVDNLSDSQVAIFAAHQHHFPGVTIEGRLQRFYPHRDLFTHTIGYVGRINQQDVTMLREQERYANYAATRTIGKLGIERFYETKLHGTVGYQTVEVNNRGRVVRTLDFTPPNPGIDIHLELDIGLQEIARDQLRERRGAIVVLDAKTGGVLAMYSNPSYDPNLFVSGISASDYRSLLNNPANPLINRATQGRYPPASTVKPHLGLLALHEEIITAESRIWDPGYFQLEGVNRRFRDWRAQGHGWVNVTRAIAESCNVFYYDISNQLGIDRMALFMREFGFGQRTGIDIREESSALMPDRGWKRARFNEPWFAGETLSVGIGQSFWTVTPLQLAYSTVILATHGQRPKPRLLRGTGERTEPELVAPIFLSPLEEVATHHWDTIRRGMEEAITSRQGTAWTAFRGVGYSTGGKTGTAQVVRIGDDVEERPDVEDVEERFRDNATYIGYAPADRPEIVVALAIENVGGGGRNAAPVARALMDFYFADETARQMKLQTIRTREAYANN